MRYCVRHRQHREQSAALSPPAILLPPLLRDEVTVEHPT